MPILFTHPVGFDQAMTEIRQGPDRWGKVHPSETFHAVTSLLSTSVLKVHEDRHDMSAGVRTFLFLCSDFGWSVFLDTFGEADPGRIRPELIHVQRGMPTKRGTNERKSRMRDGRGFIKEKYEYDGTTPVERGVSYIPRAVARVSRRTEYWTTQAEEFEHNSYFLVDPEQEWRREGDGVEAFEHATGFRVMQDNLWQTFSTPKCRHYELHGGFGPTNTSGQAIKLGPDAAALIGLSPSPEEESDPIPEKILIYLTVGRPDIRWLAIEYALHMRNQGEASREIMLRTEDCCEECALEHAASQSGKWSLIL
jgi:hypothetical protein